MVVSARRQRTVARWLHITVGAILATYVYLPPGSASWLRWALMLAGVPAVALSGVWMWKQAAFRRVLRAARARHLAPQQAPAAVARQAVRSR